jgi:hypothetical protein
MSDTASDQSATGPSTSWLDRLCGWIQPADNPSGVIYGTITAGALLAAESTRSETMPEAIASAAVALVLYWLAHTYSAALGARLGSGQAWSAGQLVRISGHEAGILKGATLPLAVLILAAGAGLSPADAVLSALIAAGVLLVGLEAIAGRRARLRGFELAVQTVVAGALGLGVVLLKVILR